MNHPCCSWFSIQALTRRRPLDSGGGQNKKKKNDSVGDENDLLLLHRRLTATDLVFYGVGCSVGAGIYSLIGIGARTAGPAIAGSFCLAGMACCFTSLAYAEFASRLHNTAGSAYTFCYVAFGELCGWLVGWNLTLGYAVSAAVVARSWAEYVTGFVSGLVGTSGNSNDGFALDRYLTKVPIPFLNSGGDNNTEYYTCCPLAMVIIALSTLVLVTGVKESARFNTISKNEEREIF
jgi:basic amino acid/polyamine antiporter, APA family